MRTKEQRLQRIESKTDRRGQQLVKLIKDGWNSIQTTSLQVGLWMLELRDGGYWKKTHDTFGEFRDELFGISERYAQYLLKGAATVVSLPKDLQCKITTESQARALADVPEEQRIVVVKKLSDNGGITAEKIEEFVSKITKKSEPATRTIVRGAISVKSESETTKNSTTEVIDKTQPRTPKVTQTPKKILFDKVGTPIPMDAEPFWKRRQEILDLMNNISEVKCAVEKAKNTQDPLYGNISNNFIVEMRSAYTHLKDGALPHAVCTQCQGSPTLQPQGCSFCGNTGLIPEYKWDHQAIKEVKELRMKTNAAHAKQYPESPLNQAANVC